MKCACLWVIGQSWIPVHHKGGDPKLPQEDGQCKACGPSSSNENREMLCATCTYNDSDMVCTFILAGVSLVHTAIVSLGRVNL